jgi:signal transduction histidine kinase
MSHASEGPGSLTLGAQEAEIARLNKVVRVLMDRAERSTQVQGSDFGLFQTTLMLEEQVGERTAQLQKALAENEKVTRALLQTKQELEQNQASQRRLIVDLEETKQHLLASEKELRRHRDHLSDLVGEQTAGLIAAKETAEAAQLLQREFIMNMSHEFRTPLHTIASYADLGFDRAGKIPTEKLVDYFLRIQQGCTRLSGMVEGLLDLSDLASGKLELRLRGVDIRILIEQVECDLDSLIKAHEFTISHVFNSDNYVAMLDADTMRKAIRCLYGNAIKYSPDGEGIEIGITDKDIEGSIVLMIRDHGPGIPAGEEEIIFEGFVQSSKTKTGAGGAGLGLTLVREVIKQHGGQIFARNAGGGGAEFCLVLPISPPSAK